MLTRRPSGHEGRLSRDALIDATLELLREGQAFAELRVSEIAARASVSRPTFYANFPDKRELALALGRTLLDAIAQEADPWLKMETDDLAGTLSGVLKAYAGCRAQLDAVLEAATYDESVAQFWRDIHEWFIGNAADRAQRQDPELSRADAEARGYVLVWMTERAFSEHLIAPRVEERALLDAVERQWRHGLA